MTQCHSNWSIRIAESAIRNSKFENARRSRNNMEKSDRSIWEKLFSLLWANFLFFGSSAKLRTCLIEFRVRRVCAYERLITFQFYIIALGWFGFVSFRLVSLLCGRAHLWPLRLGLWEVKSQVCRRRANATRRLVLVDPTSSGEL